MDFDLGPRGSTSALDAVQDVRTDPVLDVRGERGATMDQGHRHTGAEELEGAFGGGVGAADDRHFESEVRVRFREVVRDLREILAGDAGRLGLS
jgi:hypothetical protein